jgi:hypothetical protein
MGFSLKKAVKSVTKAVASPVKAAAQLVSSTASGGSEILKGNVVGGLGNIGEGAATGFTTLTTLDNSKKVDELSNGAVSNFQSAARGNSSDAIATGATLYSTYQNPTGAAAGVITGLLYPTKTTQPSAPEILYQPEQSNNSSKILLIGGGVGALALIAIILKNKGK